MQTANDCFRIPFERSQCAGDSLSSSLMFDTSKPKQDYSTVVSAGRTQDKIAATRPSCHMIMLTNAQFPAARNTASTLRQPQNSAVATTVRPELPDSHLCKDAIGKRTGLNHRHATIDLDCLASNVGRFVTGKKQNSRCNLLRSAQPANRHACQNRFPLFLIEFVIHG